MHDSILLPVLAIFTYTHKMEDHVKIKSALLKISEGCNLACTYCYMYKQMDSHRFSAKKMTVSTAKKIIHRLHDYCVENSVNEFLFCFHGGEPLLQHESFFVEFVQEANGVFDRSGIKTYYTIQTNGTLLTDRYAKLFSRLKIQVGVSLDGTKILNDQFRVFKDGRGSFELVVRNVSNCLRSPFHKKRLSVLSVINILENPVIIYDFLKDIGVCNMDLLLPYCTHDSREYSVERSRHISDWLIRLFDHWIEDKEPIRVRLFEGLIQLMLGYDYPNDFFGTQDNGILVFYSDGRVEAMDYLNVCGDGFTKTDLNVESNTIRECLNHPLIHLYCRCHRHVCEKCLECSLYQYCGGGILPTRYSDSRGFDNPSIYCELFKKLFNYARVKIASYIPSLNEMTNLNTTYTKDSACCNSYYLSSFRKFSSQNPEFCSTLVVKITTGCNLMCKYCYMFRMGDESFKFKPSKMSEDVFEKVILRIKEHIASHGIEKFHIVFHGGEPLTRGVDTIRRFCEIINQTLDSCGARIYITMQTNGVLITEEWCDLIKKYDINIGISIDGEKETHDCNRIDTNGLGSFDRVKRGIILCQRYNIRVGGLSVINVRFPPASLYYTYKSLNIKSFDILLPEATYEKPPVKPQDGMYSTSKTPYGDWLIDLFDIWWNDPSPPFVRRFYQYVRSFLGADINGDDMGNLENRGLTVETNGSYESEDALRICGSMFTVTDVNVENNPIDDIYKLPLPHLYFYAHEFLSAECTVCPFAQVCGGGYLPHRYSFLNGFDNPSIYCLDITKLLMHIRSKVVSSLAPHLMEDFSLKELVLERKNEARMYPSLRYSGLLRSFQNDQA